MSDPTRRLHPAPTAPEAPGDLQWRAPTRSYRSSHRADWLVLAFFAVLPLATSADIANKLGWSTQQGRVALLAGLVIAALWATSYYAVKIAVHVDVSASGLSVYQGPWHGEITWRDMTRLSERARSTGIAGERWIVAEAADGRRLTIPKSRVAHYERFVSDLNATFTDWRMHTERPLRDITRLDMPLLAAERPRPVAWMLGSGLSMLLIGAALFAITRAWSWLGAGLMVAGAALGLLAARRLFATHTLMLDDRGVIVRGRLASSALAWTAITGVERHRHRITAVTGVANRLLGLGLHYALSLGRWTDGALWPHPMPIELVMKGAGRRLRLRLDRIDDPDELQAHLEMRLRRVAEIRAAAPPVRRVTQRLAAVPRPSTPTDGAAPPPAQGAGSPS